MSSIGIRAFARSISDVIEGVETTGEPVVLTRHGKPVAALIPIGETSIEDFVLAHSPEFAAGMAAADRDVAAGKTRPLADVLAEIDRAEDETAATAQRDRAQAGR